MHRKRVFSREFKLDVMHQITNGEKRYSDVCREYHIAGSASYRAVLREYRGNGEKRHFCQRS